MATQVSGLLPVSSFLLLMFVHTAAAGAWEVDFAHDVVPILQKHCVGCHGGREAKGSFSINTRELIVDSGHVVPGKAAESHLWQLLISTDKEQQMPPQDQPRLSSRDVQTLRQWIDEGAVWEDGFSFAPASWEPLLKPRRPELPEAVDGRTNPVDRIIDSYLAGQQLERPEPVTDAVFLRRIHLDLIGLLPTPEQSHEFLNSNSAGRREQRIDELLAEDIAWADHWLSFFNDLLRNDYSGTGFITGGRAQVSTWLYDALLTNKPFDQMARELIAPPTPASRGYIDGIRWRGEVSAGQTVEIQFAQSVAQSFLGINLKCASCHDSFIDRWKLDEAYGMAAIYSSRPLEIHRCDKPVGRPAAASWLFPELGQIDPAAPPEERLKQLAALMTHPENGRFTRTIVNRLWYKLMGRGIVHPLDAMQTQPWNADLLDYLAVHLSDHHYDLKSVVRLIATSQAYQSKCAVRKTDTGPYVYRGPVSRRLSAEQFLDGVWQITDAAPAKIDAPVFRAVVDEAQTGQLELQGHWIWGASAATGASPPAGEKISLRKTFSLDDEVSRGGAVITCDNSYTLYINGREIQRGDDWQEPQIAALHTNLKKGDNQIVVVAVNAGDRPNPAGLYFEARLLLADGSSRVIASDETWEWNAAVPAGREGRLGAIGGKWSSAIVVPAVSSWTAVLGRTGRSLLAQVVSDKIPMVRASLLKSDFLMRSMGRPQREQIVSMRPEELTTLEAIDLANGSALADALKTGASQLRSREWSSPEELVSWVFQFALTRDPSPQELQIVMSVMDDSMSQEAVEDLLWSVFMMPEYLLVR